MTSLPSRYGIGDVGPSAFAWVDRLAAAGQPWWQVLPLGPTGYGHSPYQALSSFVANPLLISPEQLEKDGLLEPGDREDCSFPSDHVDFERVAAFKERLLACAWKNFRSGARADLRSAFEQFYVPAGAPTAVSGHWAPGPGADFFDKAQRALGGLPLLAEDLGVITPAVTALRDQFQLPGMRVLQFAFNGDPNNPHLPDHYVQNSAVYTGTHDNDTTRGWYDTLPEHERRNLWSYLQRPAAEPHEATWELIRLAWSSVAALAITPLQDLLGLGSAARMNVPGRAEGQWGWRCPGDALNDASWERLGELTRGSGRLAGRDLP